MDSFDEILYKKDKEIKECDEFIEFICEYFNKCAFDNSNSNILISLLLDKINLYKSLEYKLNRNILNDIKNIDEYIYRQIKILKHEILNDFEEVRKEINYIQETSKDELNSKKQSIISNLEKKYKLEKTNAKNKSNNNAKLDETRNYKVYKNKFFDKIIYQKAKLAKIEALCSILSFIRNNQFISTVLFFGFGLIVFFIHFGLKYKYIPFLQYQELLSIIVYNSAFLLLLAISLVVLYGFWYLYNTDKISGNFADKKWFYTNSLFVYILAFLLSIFTVLFILPYLNSFIKIFYELAPILILIFSLLVYIWLISWSINSEKVAASLFSIFTLALFIPSLVIQSNFALLFLVRHFLSFSHFHLLGLC
ncbi:Uncharacterised protein [Campylobacter geochelonis]|uniref:Uncharacterized protein n=1 Tax=Campylobacter geochelonis TaxID=1780362 RepID=A0A128EH57_9BACT|nr:Uncharacterised protein [Campylobacter geochelonis]